jgi:hypothetical protein
LPMRLALGIWRSNTCGSFLWPETVFRTAYTACLLELQIDRLGSF